MKLPASQPLFFCLAFFSLTQSSLTGWTMLDAPLPQHRFLAGSAVVGSKLYVFGGEYEFLKSNNTVLTLDVSKPSPQWQLEGHLPHNLICGDSRAMVIGSKVYLISCTTASSLKEVSGLFWIYDTITKKTDTSRSMLRPYFSSCVVKDSSNIYVIGGFDKDTNTYVAILQVYNIATNRWEIRSSMHARRGWMACAYSEKTRSIYVFGGHNSTDHLNSAEKYNTQTNKWTPMNVELKDTTSDLSAVVVQTGATGETIYVIGGEMSPANEVDTVYAFDAGSETLRETTSLPFPLCDYAYGVIGRRLYISGGFIYPPTGPSLKTFVSNVL